MPEGGVIGTFGGTAIDHLDQKEINMRPNPDQEGTEDRGVMRGSAIPGGIVLAAFVLAEVACFVLLATVL